MSFTGTDIVIAVQESSDDGAGDAFADVTNGVFTSAAAIGSERIATTNTDAIEQYLRINTTTVGGFTECTFAVVVVRNSFEIAF